jgi:hypothetical protein
MFSLDEAGKRNNSNEKYFSNIDLVLTFRFDLKKSRNKTNFNNCCVVEQSFRVTSTLINPLVKKL